MDGCLEEWVSQGILICNTELLDCLRASSRRERVEDTLSKVVQEIRRKARVLVHQSCG